MKSSSYVESVGELVARRKRKNVIPKPKLSMSVAAAPWSLDDQGEPRLTKAPLLIDTEVSLLRTALLYADDIELVSPRTEALKQIQDLRGLDGPDLLRAIGKKDLATAQWLGIQADPHNWGEISTLLRNSGAGFTQLEWRLRSQCPPERRADVEAAIQGMKDAVDSLPDQIPDIHKKLEAQRRDNRYDEIASLLEGRRLRLKATGGTAAASEHMRQELTKALSRLASDSSRYLLTDDACSGIVTELIRSGCLIVPSRAASNARAAQLQYGLVDRLPTLPYAPLDVIIEVRQEMDGELHRFREEIATLSSTIEKSAFDGEFAAEVQHLWMTQVYPALEDIRRSMKASVVIRSLVDKVSAISGTAAATAIGAVTFGIMPDPVGFLTIASGSATSVGNSALKWFDLEENRKQMRFYFLYEVERKSARST